MPAWNDYSVKDATPADTDTLMIKDNAATGTPNKRLLFSKLFDYIMSKTYAFTQGTKSIPEAINELKTATETDSTLSTSGKAADAKAAGDSINTLTDAIGDLTKLETTEKSSIVGAINETLENAGISIAVNGTCLEITRNTGNSQQSE